MQYIHFLNEDFRNILYAFMEWNCYLLFANFVLQNFIWHGFQITNNSNICALLLYATSIWSAPRSSFNTVEKLRIHGLNYFIAVGKQAEGQTCVHTEQKKLGATSFTICRLVVLITLRLTPKTCSCMKFTCSNTSSWKHFS